MRSATIGDAHDPQGAGPIRHLGRGLGAPHPVRAGHDADGRPTSAASTRSARCKLFADWTDRIAAGELPFAQPPRPQGIERNVVLTLWDWSRPTAYLHDEISTDKRNPTVNANGKLYGATEESTDLVPVLDPAHNTATRGQASGARSRTRRPRRTHPMAPSPYWGDEPIWDSQTSMHNPMMDEKGRVWFTARVRPPANPDFCKKGSNHPSAQGVPARSESNRHLSMYDPTTGKFTLISTCFPTHHLIFAEDANNTLWTSAGGPQAPASSAGSTARCSRRPATRQKSQGWTPFILDTNGNGKRDDYVEPDQPVDPDQGQARRAGLYSVAVNPVDGTIWGTVARISRLRGSGRSRTRSDAHRAHRSLRAAVRPATGRAAATSTATASSGRRSRAAISRASTAASARTAQRADRDRQALPRGLDALSLPGPAVRGT